MLGPDDRGGFGGGVNIKGEDGPGNNGGKGGGDLVLRH